MLGIRENLWENLSSVPHLSPCLGLLITAMQMQAGCHHRGALPEQRRLTHASPMSSGPSLGDSTDPALLCLSLVARASPLPGTCTPLPPLYLRDTGKARALEPDCLIPQQCLTITTV